MAQFMYAFNGLAKTMQVMREVICVLRRSSGAPSCRR
jgi:hypothetical protein